MASELKHSVVRGMAWTAAEKTGTMLFQMCVSLVLAWFLMPEDYALIGILVVFVTICTVFVDSGFSAALIRRREVSDEDYTSVFAFNVLVGVFLYAILTLLASPVADFYGIPGLKRVAPVLFLVIPVNSLCIIQSTILTRRLDFKTQTKYTLWANFTASGVAVCVAFAGGGVWALVAQRVVTPVVRSLLLWIKGDWRPARKFGIKPLRSMLGYSSRLLASDLANSVYGNISQLFIGKMYTPAQLGFYEQARKLKDMPVTSIVNTIQGVSFPALSRLQDDPVKLGFAAHQVVAVMNFLIYPAMIGLIAVAPDMFAVLLPERWLPTVPYFQILCLSGLFVPLSVVSYNIQKIKSDGKLILRLEILKKAIATVVLAITIPSGVTAIVWGQVVIFLCDAVVNAFGAGRYVKWRFAGRLAEILPYLLLSAVMWVSIYGIGIAFKGMIAPHWVLLVKIVFGAAVYLIFGWLFKPEAWKEVAVILRDRHL